MDKVKEILMSAARGHQKVLTEQELFVRMTEHSDSALTYTVRVWCKKEDYWDVKFDITERIRKDFADNNIEIPFPQLDIHQR
jgi:small conductance mechanosensitive channel